MKITTSAALIVAVFLNITALPSRADSENKLSFECDVRDGIPVSRVEIEQGEKSEDKTFLSWITKYFPDRDIAEKRCEEVAEKLEELYEKGKLKSILLTPAIVDEQAVVCLQGETDGECQADQVLFVLENVEKPGQALREMMPENLRDKNPITVRGDFPTKLDFNWLPF
jgi:hypothetical protein